MSRTLEQDPVTQFKRVWPSPCGCNLSRVLPVFLLLFIPELFSPGPQRLTLDWPVQDCPAVFFPVVHQFWPPPWWIFPPQANSLVFEFKFERSSSAGFAAGGCSCRGTYTFTSKPKTSLQLCGRRPNFPDHSILCVELLLIFVGFKKLRQKSSGATKSIYTAFVAAQRPCVAPSVWFQLFLQLSICSLSVSLSFLFLWYVSF